METRLELDVLIFPDEVRIATPDELREWELETLSQASPIPTIRLFVALYPYNPAAMSPNHETAAEELPFVPGQIIKVNYIVVFTVQNLNWDMWYRVLQYNSCIWVVFPHFTGLTRFFEITRQCFLFMLHWGQLSAKIQASIFSLFPVGIFNWLKWFAAFYTESVPCVIKPSQTHLCSSSETLNVINKT